MADVAARSGEERPKTGGVQSLERVFELLELMADAGGEMGLSQLAAGSGLPIPTIHRLIRTLADLGYVRQKAATRRYILGPRLIRLGESAKGMLGTWAKPFLSELVELSGETANLAVLDGSQAVYVAQVPTTRHSLRMFTEVGRHVPLHCSGVGKMLLAQLPTADARDIVDRTGLPAQTPATITKPVQLMRELDQIRQRGYALDDGEQEIGVKCVAVAVPASPLLAAISVSAPEARLPDSVRTALVPQLQRVAEEFGRSLLQAEETA